MTTIKILESDTVYEASAKILEGFEKYQSCTLDSDFGKEVLIELGRLWRINLNGKPKNWIGGEKAQKAFRYKYLNNKIWIWRVQ